MTTEQVRGKPAEKSSAIGFGSQVYQHVAAVVGGFAFLTFVGNFVHFDWHGFLATLVGAWADYVRPPVQWFVHYVAEVPLGWLGWHIQFPQWLHDYLAAGVVLTASLLRTARNVLGWRGTLRTVFSWKDGEGKPRQALGIARAILPMILVWPIVFAFYLVVVVRALTRADWTSIRLTGLIVSPLIYAGILLGMNLVLR